MSHCCLKQLPTVQAVVKMGTCTVFTDQITVFILRLKEENNIIKHVIIFSKQILNKSTAAGDQSNTCTDI